MLKVTLALLSTVLVAGIPVRPEGRSMMFDVDGSSAYTSQVEVVLVSGQDQEPQKHSLDSKQAFVPLASHYSVNSTHYYLRPVIPKQEKIDLATDPEDSDSDSDGVTSKSLRLGLQRVLKPKNSESKKPNQEAFKPIKPIAPGIVQLHPAGDKYTMSGLIPPTGINSTVVPGVGVLMTSILEPIIPPPPPSPTSKGERKPKAVPKQLSSDAKKKANDKIESKKNNSEN